MSDPKSNKRVFRMYPFEYISSDMKNYWRLLIIFIFYFCLSIKFNAGNVDEFGYFDL